ncbi:MAG: hypothetical protein ACFE9R_18660 [Candidatus Hermodarchaeota archaeon]
MSKKKIFYVLSIFLLLGITVSALNVRAHAPANIDMQFDVDTQILDVIYTHGVSNPEYHYIESIEVWVNVTQVWEDHNHHTHFDDQDNYALAIRPSVAPNYTFYFTEQPIDITPITVSHTLARYYLNFSLFLPFPATLTGEQIEGTPISDVTGEPVPYLGEGRTNITLSATCSLGGVLTEHYYIGLPYYNPHLGFSQAAIPGTVSTIIVLTLLFTLPKLGQKNAPKLQESKNRK